MLGEDLKPPEIEKELKENWLWTRILQEDYKEILAVKGFDELKYAEVRVEVIKRD
jgi:hypothetical protein